MQVATPQFFEEITGSHRVFSYVDVVGPNGDVLRLSATDGSVTVDRTATVRRECTVSCIDATGTITPKNATDVLTPTGTEIKPYRGVIYPGGVTEVVPLGVFHVSKVTVTDAQSTTPAGGGSAIGVTGGGGGGGGTPGIVIEGYDRSRTMARAKFITPYTVAVGTNIIQAIKDIVARTFPDVTYDSISTTLTNTAPLVYDVANDPWTTVTDLANQVGCEIYFDATGNIVIAPPVDVDHLPSSDWDFIEGNGCMLLGLSVVYTDEPGYNGVVLTGESSGDEVAPIRSVVWDAEPSSPTYHLGPYGEVPMFVTNSIVKTQSDADSVAQATLNSVVGITAQLSLTTMVNPALDASDTVQVTRAKSGIMGKYAIDSLQIPMNATSTSSITLRAKRVVS